MHSLFLTKYLCCNIINVLVSLANVFVTTNWVESHRALALFVEKKDLVKMILLWSFWERYGSVFVVVCFHF